LADEKTESFAESNAIREGRGERIRFAEEKEENFANSHTGKFTEHFAQKEKETVANTNTGRVAVACAPSNRNA
jgi:hypothetical protein